ncbi:MAG: ferritin family protein [Candidatus Aminicenantes bacterium]|nr:ferritin family protein [Candidatus Aminicenantes bacterium]
MDIFALALDFEKESERYYRDLAERCDQPGLKQILNMLADDEVKHFQVVSAMRDGSHPQMPATEVLPRAKNRFSAMKQISKDLCYDSDEIELYRKALTKEEHAETFYREQAAAADSPENAELLNRLADEERQHRFLIENMIEFLHRPQRWVEDAEFNHLEEY